jgi:phosphate transport system substrate-binding protein
LACFIFYVQPAIALPNHGKVTIAIDNTVQPIIADQLDIFGYDQPETNIDARFLSENEIFKSLLRDSIHFAVTTRKLKQEERLHFAHRKIEIYENKVASDAVAIVVSLTNPMTKLGLSQLQDIFFDKIQTWDKIMGASGDKIQLILDQNGSSIQRTLMEKLGSHALDSKNIFSLKGNRAVIEYVSNHPNAIGFIGFNWLKNNDSLSTRLSSKVNVVAISDTIAPIKAMNFYRPTPESIYYHKYPFVRSIYTISVEGYVGLGTGFAVFLGSDKGQLIFSKSGVLPVRGANREVHLN